VFIGSILTINVRTNNPTGNMSSGCEEAIFWQELITSNPPLQVSLFEKAYSKYRKHLDNCMASECVKYREARDKTQRKLAGTLPGTLAGTLRASL
jgi:hypothetical protein